MNLLARLVSDADDALLERRFGSPMAQRALFAASALAFDSQAAAGFKGGVVYELARPATGREPLIWTLEVGSGRATARRGRASEPALTLRLPLADFMRVISRTIDPAQPILENRLEIEGDLAVAARLPEMFGV